MRISRTTAVNTISLFFVILLSVPIMAQAFWRNASAIPVIRLLSDRNADADLQQALVTQAEQALRYSGNSEDDRQRYLLAQALITAHKHAWDQTLTYVDDYLRVGGDPQILLSRFRGLAIYHKWCVTYAEPLLRVLQKLSTSVEGLHILATICTFSGNPEQAIEAYRQAFALSQDPIIASDLMWHLLTQAEILYSQDQAQAFILLDEIIVLSEQQALTGPRDYYTLARSLWLRNRFSESLFTYQECLTSAGDPGDLNRYTCALHLGSAYALWLPEEERNPRLARNALQEAIRIANIAGIDSSEPKQLLHLVSNL